MRTTERKESARATARPTPTSSRRRQRTSVYVFRSIASSSPPRPRPPRRPAPRARSSVFQSYRGLIGIQSSIRSVTSTHPERSAAHVGRSDARRDRGPVGARSPGASGASASDGAPAGRSSSSVRDRSECVLACRGSLHGQRAWQPLRSRSSSSPGVLRCSPRASSRRAPTRARAGGPAAVVRGQPSASSTRLPTMGPSG
jgi:hypothetical protein